MEIGLSLIHIWEDECKAAGPTGEADIIRSLNESDDFVLKRSAARILGLVLLNSVHPEAAETRELAEELSQRYGVTVYPVNCLTLEQEGILEILGRLLYEFPVREMDFYLPGWVTALPEEHPVKTELYKSLLDMARQAEKLSQTPTQEPSPSRW